MGEYIEEGRGNIEDDDKDIIMLTKKMSISRI